MKKVLITMLVLLLLLTSCGTGVPPLNAEDPKDTAPSQNPSWDEGSSLPNPSRGEAPHPSLREGIVEFLGEHDTYKVETGDCEIQGDSYYLKREYWKSEDGGLTWTHFSKSISLEKSEYRLQGRNVGADR